MVMTNDVGRTKKKTAEQIDDEDEEMKLLGLK